MRGIVIGSRGSDLALRQANYVKELLEKQGVQVQIKIIKTQGDNFFNVSFTRLEGKGFFTKELEEELLKGTIDLAVHSYKDLPSSSPPGLKIGAITEREDPADVLLVNPECVDRKEIFSIVRNAKVGTSSPRRKAQLFSHRADLNVDDLRGNVPNRIQKLRDKNFDAILIAQAGINRLSLDLEGLHVERLSPKMMVPAPAQGVLALQIREDDVELDTLLSVIHCREVEDEVAIERKVLTLFNGGCHMPFGIYCKKENNRFLVWTCKATNAFDFPDRFFTEDTDPEELPQTVFHQFHPKISPVKSVFITRDIHVKGYLQSYLESKGIKLKGRSLIRTFPVILKMDSTILKNIDWIFFNSQNAVHYFFDLQPKLSEAIQLGVMGRGSEAALRKLGYQAQFIGETSDTVTVAKEFSKRVEGKTVLFPQSKDSIRTIQNNLGPLVKSVDLPIYETEIDRNPVFSTADIIIFTSPTNVTSYIERNFIDAGQKVIALGKSTGEKLKEYNIHNFVMPYSPDEVGLSEAVFSLL